MTKKQYHHGGLKKDLLDKGLQLLTQEGFKGFSLRKVANMCGVSHSAPYKHFKNKDELISAISIEVINSFKDSLNTVRVKYPDDPKLQLKHMGKQYIQFFVENPDYLKFLFLSDFDFSVEIEDDTFIYCKDDPFGIFKDTAQNYLTSNSSNYEENILDIFTMWSLVHGIAVLIANKNVKYKGDYLALVDKILDENL